MPIASMTFGAMSRDYHVYVVLLSVQEALGLTPSGTFLSLCHFKGLQTVTAQTVFN